MVSVSRKWIKENVEKLYAFGGQIDKDAVLKMHVPRGGFETTLTKTGKEQVGYCERKEKFHILIPEIGWADVFGCGFRDSEHK